MRTYAYTAGPGLEAQPTTPTITPPYIGAGEKGIPFSIDFTSRMLGSETVNLAAAGVLAYSPGNPTGTDATAGMLTPPVYRGSVSPQATVTPGSAYVAPPTVTITGDGQGAVGVVTLTGSGLGTFTLLYKGYGYTHATATLSGGGGSGGAITLTVNPNDCTVFVGNQNAVPGDSYTLTMQVETTTGRWEEQQISGILCPLTSASETIMNGLTIYPTNAPQGGSTITTGHGSTNDIYTFASLVQADLQNNTNDVVYVAAGQGTPRAATQGDYELLAGSPLYEIPGWVSWVSLYADPSVPVNGTSPGYALTGQS